MPDIPIFLALEDVKGLSEMLGEDPEIAVIDSVSEPSARMVWRAYPRLSLVDGKSYCLWHRESGPVLAAGEHKQDPEWIQVPDPYAGWEASPYNNNWDLPNVGDKPQFFTLQIQVEDRRFGAELGLSHISWIGSRYEPAPDPALKWWRSLRARIRKRSTPVKGNGINTDESSFFDCWPAAYARIGSEA